MFFKFTFYQKKRRKVTDSIPNQRHIGRFVNISYVNVQVYNLRKQ